MNEQLQNHESTLSEVTNLILNTVHMNHVDRSTLSAQTALTQGGLSLDSVEVLEVVVAIEQYFKVKVENAEQGKQHFQTLGTIAAFVDSHRA